MSLLNQANDGLKSVLVALYGYLCHAKKTSKQNLLDICAPKSVTTYKDTDGKEKIQEMARKTLRTWIKLGLFSEEADETDKEELNLIQLCPELPSYPSSLDFLTLLRFYACERIFHPDNNQEDFFWSNVDNRSADITRALAWSLAQDVYTFPGKNYNKVGELELSQFRNKDFRALQNNTRWAGFQTWSVFLGFAWVSEEQGIIIDPTPVIRMYLPILFNEKKELSQKEFRFRLAKRLPVFDEGIYRQQVEKELDAEFWRSSDTKLEISSSLSRALLCLEKEGQIRFEARADADACFLLGSQHRRVRDPRDPKDLRISHLIFNKEQESR